ncbi:hypothetical protein PRUPE_3G160000 [Prunus persica]|uniref:Uncharacterized protein n=1 Tax=Prunus persica TaxID=3760 RepID=A0A251Q0V3_PRUPE|nr:hypothetical protein PRUPE_3G160000 [Prunus persica]
MAAQHKNPQIENVVMMLPSSIRCSCCSTVMAKGTKFNSRKEETLGEVLTWDHTFRFCFNCTQFSAEIVIRTDPQCSHLAVEAGASKFYKKLVPCTGPNWQEKREEVLANRKRKIEEVGDAMKSLDFKREMDNPDAVDVITHATLSENASLEALQQRATGN